MTADATEARSDRLHEKVQIRPARVGVRRLRVLLRHMISGPQRLAASPHRQGEGGKQEGLAPESESGCGVAPHSSHTKAWKAVNTEPAPADHATTVRGRASQFGSAIGE
jgi:hypothetical protein